MTAVGFVLLWLRAFALTLLIELPVAVPLLRASARPDAPAWRRAGLVLFANLASHPLLWFALSALPLPGAWTLGLSETWAVLAEAALYRLALDGVPLRRCILASLAANAASLSIGLALRSLTHAV
jgi:hypothetical protein